VTAKVRANEPGNLLYQLTRSRVDANTYRFFELYKNEDALARHSQTECYKEMMSKGVRFWQRLPRSSMFDAIV
jgi:quinol monooxygenase YgiN